MDILSSLKIKLGMKTKIEQLGKVAITVDEDYWSSDKSYDRLVIVEDKNSSFCYLSRIPVPAGDLNDLSNRKYWICIGKRAINVDLSGFVKLQSIDDLPNEYTDDSYLINNVIYYYVGEGGDTLDGLYQSWDIRGPKGDTGDSAYDLYVKNGGTKSEEEWLTSLKGEPGERGATGYSAYEMWLNEMREETGDPTWFAPVANFIEAITGKDGKDGAQGSKGDTGKAGPQGIQGPSGPQGAPGANGTNGKSAYEQYVEYCQNHDISPIYTQEQWMANFLSLGGSNPSNSDIEITDNKIIIYLDDDVVANAPELIEPISGMIKFDGTTTSKTIKVRGRNLTNDITLILSNNRFVIPGSQVLSAASVCTDDGVDVLLQVNTDSANASIIYTGTLIISTDGEVEDRILNLSYQKESSSTITPVRPGTSTEKNDEIDITKPNI